MRLLIHFDCHGKIPISSRGRPSPQFIRSVLYSHFPRTCRPHSRRCHRCHRAKSETTQFTFPFVVPRERKILFQYFTAYALSLVAGRASSIQNTLARGQTARCVATPPPSLSPGSTRMTYRRFPYLALGSRRELLRKPRENRTLRRFRSQEHGDPTVDYTTAPCLTACQKSVYSGYR